MLCRMTREGYIRPRNRLKSWAEMREDEILGWLPRLDEVILKKDSFLTEAELECRQYHYSKEEIPTTIERDTLFWYEPGRHSKGPEIAGIYLKRVIPKDIQETAYDALHSMKWEKPKMRPEYAPRSSFRALKVNYHLWPTFF